MNDASQIGDDEFLNRYAGYLYDCLAAETEWSRALNVLRQKDVSLVPLTSEQQTRLGTEGSLALDSPAAVELGNRLAMSGAQLSLTLGALFLVGSTHATRQKPRRQLCAPLLEVPIRLDRDLTRGRVVLEPEETEFRVNHGFVSCFLQGANRDELRDRLADLAMLVPDFPIDEHEFRDFWNGFRMIVAEIPLSSELPARRGARGRQAVAGDPPQTSSAQASPGAKPDDPASIGSDPGVDNAAPLPMVDFYQPVIPNDGFFRLLPATTLILSRRGGRSGSALEELDRMTRERLDCTAFASVFDPGAAQATTSAAPSDIVLHDAFPLPLTTAQEAVVRSSRSAPLTVVTGPPGTGKSYTITAIVLDALLRGQSVLVASQMDKAVEVVTRQVERIAGPLAMARSGGRVAQRELAKKISSLTGPKRRAAPVLADVPAAERKKTARRHQEAHRRVKQLEDRYRTILAQELRWCAAWQEYQRMAPICPLPIQEEVTRRRFQRACRAARSVRRANAPASGSLRRWWGRWQRRRLLRLLGVADDWPGALNEIDEALHVHDLRLEVAEIERNLRAPFPADSAWSELARWQNLCNEEALRLLRQNREAAIFRLTRDTHDRQQLRDFRTLLRRRNPKLKRELRARIDPTVPLRAFPGWASTSRALGQILPATPAVFDLVVIDEASQCDLATAAVALFRGRRAVVVGDPNQLRHVCFLGKAREQAAFTRHALGSDVQQRLHYRRSLFDVAADAVDQDHFFMLDEHFRSDPRIIGFSNRRFYGEQLSIMTAKPRREAEAAIEVVKVDGRREAGTSVNKEEVNAALSVVASYADAATDGAAPASLGIVCPFRDQVDALSEHLLDRFNTDVIQRHEIVVGTAHSLQGDEKDVVIFSTSIDPAFHVASLRFLEHPNLFNVAITRARRRVIIVTSVSKSDLPTGLLRDYLDYARQTVEPDRPSDCHANTFVHRVADELAKQGLHVWPGFLAAGVRIDVAALSGDRYVAVCCDGSRGGDADAIDPLDCHRTLARAGWAVRRIPHRSWDAAWYPCLEHVIKVLSE